MKYAAAIIAAAVGANAAAYQPPVVHTPSAAPEYPAETTSVAEEYPVEHTSVAEEYPVEHTSVAEEYPAVTTVTEVYHSTVFDCPEPTTITYGQETITVTKPEVVTVCDSGCTYEIPITVTSTVECHECAVETHVPAEPTYVPHPPAAEPPAHNGTDSSYSPPAPPAATPEVPTAGAAKVAGLSGLVAFIGLAFVL